MEKPDVDRIDGISPAIAIRQKNSIRNPRSTVGTTTEIHDYMRLLYARVGRTYCRNCGREVVRETAEVVARQLGALTSGTRLLIGFDLPVLDASVPVADAVEVDELAEQPEELAAQAEREPKASRQAQAERADQAVAATIAGLRKKGFARLLIDGAAVGIEDVDAAALRDRAVLQVVVDRVQISGEDLRQRLTDSIEMSYSKAAARRGRWSSRQTQSSVPGRPPVFRALRVPAVRDRVRGSAAAPVLVQQPVRRLPDLPRLRQHHRARHGPGRAGSVEVDPSKAPSSRGPSRTIARSSPS